MNSDFEIWRTRTACPINKEIAYLSYRIKMYKKENLPYYKLENVSNKSIVFIYEQY